MLPSMKTPTSPKAKEIKNIGKTYTEVSKKILPQLRRSQANLVMKHHNLTDEEIFLVQNSVKMIRKSMEEFSTAFYQELFQMNPMVKKLFISNIKSQILKFAQVFELLVTSLDNMDKLLPALKSLGKRHNNYGVEEYHYQIVSIALINTLRNSLGAQFTPEIENAWLKTYGLVTMIMVDSSKGLM